MLLDVGNRTSHCWRCTPKVSEILLERLTSCTDYNLRARLRNAVGWSKDPGVQITAKTVWKERNCSKWWSHNVIGDTSYMSKHTEGDCGRIHLFSSEVWGSELNLHFTSVCITMDTHDTPTRFEKCQVSTGYGSSRMHIVTLLLHCIWYLHMNCTLHMTRMTSKSPESSRTLPKPQAALQTLRLRPGIWSSWPGDLTFSIFSSQMCTMASYNVLQGTKEQCGFHKVY